MPVRYPRRSTEPLGTGVGTNDVLSCGTSGRKGGLCGQAAANIAVVTGLAPAKVIGLPLVSAGGSGVLFLAADVGLPAGAAAETAGRGHGIDER